MTGWLKIFLFLGMAVCFLTACSDYDYDRADTKANRAGFERHLGGALPPGVTGIYFFADEWGKDASYWFAFSAPPDTVGGIIAKLGLKPGADRRDRIAPPVSTTFVWWSIDERKKSEYYEFRDEAKRVDRFLWYCPETQKCQVAVVCY